MKHRILALAIALALIAPAQAQEVSGPTVSTPYLTVGNFLTLNSNASDNQGGALSGNAIGTMTPTLGTINSIQHDTGLFMSPQIDNMIATNAFNAAYDMKWGTGATASNPVPAGTKGWLSGYECSINTSQSLSDVADSYDSDHCVGATLTSNTTGGVPVHFADATITTAGSNAIGLNLSIKNNSGAGYRTGTYVSIKDSGSGGNSIGFEADSTGSTNTLGNAFSVQGGKWAVSFSDEGQSSAGEQSTFSRFIGVGDSTGANPFFLIGNTGNGVGTVGTFDNFPLHFLVNNALALAFDTSKNATFQAHIGVSAAAPTLSACGTGPTLNSNASDDHATVTEGTTATGCTITFAAAYGAAPDCIVTSPTGSALTSYSTSTTALTLVNASASGDKFSYICMQ